MSHLSRIISDFRHYSYEFGVGAAIRILLVNNRFMRSVGSLRSLKIKGYEKPFFYREALTDLPILRAIIGQQLVYKPSAPPKLIVDAGANVGYVSVFYAKHFPGAAIYSIEMEGSNYEVLLKNTSGYPNIKPVNAALWDHSNGVSFSSDNNPLSYSVLDKKAADQKAPSVTLADILRLAKTDVIDLLKLDIEAAEIEVLNWMGAENLQPRVLMVETHDRFRAGCTEALENYLKGRKYRRSIIHEYEIVEFD